MVKERNIILVYLFLIITLGIYGIYWMVSTKNEINSLGAKIPTAWLMIIPIVNIYWVYKYCEGFAVNAKKDNRTVVWFIVYIVIGIIMPAIIQSTLNKIARGTSTPESAQDQAAAPAANQAPVEQEAAA